VKRLHLFLVFAFSFALFYLWQFQTAYLPENDGYYHVKYAYLLGQHGFMRQFPWAQLSLWYEHFSDKEFLFHVYLVPFTWIFQNLHTAGKVATIILSAGVVTSFFAILTINQIRKPILWTILLCSSGGYFLYRANVCRPQVLSIILCLWSIHFLINNKRKSLAALCFLYTTAYTGYILPLIFSLIVGINSYLFEKEKEWKIVLVVFASTLAGMVFHPYFPDNFTMFWLQNFYILWMGTNSNVDLKMGGEFRPMDTKKAFEVITAVLIPYWLVIFSSLKNSLPTDKKTRQLFLISLALLILTMVSKRFAEYSVPVTLWFCASYFSKFFEIWTFKKLSEKFGKIRKHRTIALLASQLWCIYQTGC
jgi:hypothetical protein